MKRALFAVVVAILEVAAAPARAAGGQLVIEARTGWTILGTKNPTGGFTPGAAASYLFSLGEGVGLGLGADFGIFGFGGASRWIGILAGPTARLSLKAGNAPLAFSFTVAADFGRVPVCTPWEHPICPRFVGIFPSAALAGAYVSQGGIMVGGSFSVRVVNTLISTTASYEPALFVGLFLSSK